MKLEFFDEVKQLTKDMVEIPSIVRDPNGGESKVAKYIYDYYMELDYFKENPDQVVYQKTINDLVDRHNCIAMVKGTKGDSNNTIIMLGHIDTVEIDDFHEIKEFATQPDLLPEKLRQLNLSDKINEDIDSGEFMFGRGALDMKSGVAGHMAILRYFSENPDQLNGNLIAIGECDEEDNSFGIISALDILSKWKKDHNLEYIAAINADYSTPHHEDDMNRYIYLGTIGKLLPSFFAFGSESHVGHPFSGFDPNYLMAELTKLINLNPELTDIAQGERTMPPVSLKQADTKVGYTVQTALEAQAYYNFFTHSMNPKEVVDLMKDTAEEAFENAIKSMNDKYKKYCELTGEKFVELPWEKRVYTWGEYYNRLKEKHGHGFVEHIDEFSRNLAETTDLDLRDFSNAVIKEAYDNFEYDKAPTLVMYLGSIYSAPIELTGDEPSEVKLVQYIEESIDEMQEDSDRPLVTKYFYPYISDSSFMAIDSDLSSLEALGDNMPTWGYTYHHPVKEILDINVPVANVGTFGYDGHSIGERVHMHHTFQIIPNITFKTILKMLG